MFWVMLIVGLLAPAKCAMLQLTNYTDVEMAGLIALSASSFPTAFANNISEGCFNDSRTYLSSFLKQESYAVQMYGATGKFPVVGPSFNDHLAAPGLFEPCLAASPTAQYCTAFFQEEPANIFLILNQIFSNRKNNKTEKLQQPFSWVYVNNRNGIVKFNRHLPSGPYLIQPKWKTKAGVDQWAHPAHVGYCMPSSCSHEDVASAVAQQLAVTVNMKQIVPIVDENYCYTNQKLNNLDVKFDRVDKALTFMFCFLGVIVVVATLNEYWREHRGKSINARLDSRLIVILNCFSALSNYRKLLAPSPCPRLACMDGIRFLSSTWIVLFHLYVFSNNAPIYNRYGSGDLYKWQMQIISCCVGTETYVLLGGILVSLSLLKELDRCKGRINIILFYLQRYFRITIMYALVVGIVATLVVHLGSGPYWQYVHNFRYDCRLQGWAQFLYFGANPCIGSAWYLTLDMKLFLISPLFVYPLWRWRKAGFLWIVFSILSLLGYIVFYIMMKYDGMTTTELFRPFTRKNSFPLSRELWFRMPSRLGALLLGGILYYMMKKQTKLILSRFAVTFGWFLSLATIGCVIFGLTPYLDERKVPKLDEFVRVTYGSFYRVAWASAVSWIIVACSCGYGGIINSILSWKPFTVLSRLTFPAFLIHEVIIRVYYMGYLRQPHYYSLVNLFFVNNLAVQVLSLVLSFILTIWAEMPLVNLAGIALAAPRNRNR